MRVVLVGEVAHDQLVAVAHVRIGPGDGGLHERAQRPGVLHRDVAQRRIRERALRDRAVFRDQAVGPRAHALVAVEQRAQVAFAELANGAARAVVAQRRGREAKAVHGRTVAETERAVEVQPERVQRGKRRAARAVMVEIPREQRARDPSPLVRARHRDGADPAGERVAPAHVHLVVVEPHRAGEDAVAHRDHDRPRGIVVAHQHRHPLREGRERLGRVVSHDGIRVGQEPRELGDERRVFGGWRERPNLQLARGRDHQ